MFVEVCQNWRFVHVSILHQHCSRGVGFFTTSRVSGCTKKPAVEMVIKITGRCFGLRCFSYLQRRRRESYRGGGDAPHWLFLVAVRAVHPDLQDPPGEDVPAPNYELSAAGATAATAFTAITAVAAVASTVEAARRDVMSLGRGFMTLAEQASGRWGTERGRARRGTTQLKEAQSYAVLRAYLRLSPARTENQQPILETSLARSISVLENLTTHTRCVVASLDFCGRKLTTHTRCVVKYLTL